MARTSDARAPGSDVKAMTSHTIAFARLARPLPWRVHACAWHDGSFTRRVCATGRRGHAAAWRVHAVGWHLHAFGWRVDVIAWRVHASSRRIGTCS